MKKIEKRNSVEMVIREFFKEVGLSILDFFDCMAEAHQRRMNTATPCGQCQETYLYKELVPHVLWIYSQSPLDKWIQPKEGFLCRRYCHVCWEALYKRYGEEYRLATYHKREYARVEMHNDRARQMGREATLSIAQWLATLNRYNWRCAYCTGPYEALEHQKPLIAPDGGTTAINCIPSCQSCNSRKGIRHPNEIMHKETSLSPEAHRRIQVEMEALHGNRIIIS